MEGLHYAISNAVNSSLIRRIKLSSSNITISHIFYADDVIVTTEWNSSNLDNFIRILYVFYLALGLKIIIHKSNIYGFGAPNDEVADMDRRTGCASGSFLFKYLRLLIGSNLNLNSSCLGIYYLLIFKAPELILKSLERSRATSFLGESQDSKKLAWIKRSNALSYYEKGDLNAVDDHCVWTMAKDDIFFVGESRRIIESKLLSSLVPSTSWDKTLSHKVNIFIWRLALDRLPHRWNLSAQGIDIPSISCPSCNGNVESSFHIFFDCEFAKEVWKLFHNWCNISIPLFYSFELWKAWFDSWHTPKEKSRLISIIVTASLGWIWAECLVAGLIGLNLLCFPRVMFERCCFWSSSTGSFTF
ncbi:RNA-directed DNA polymerase, eukaryota, reverse transcriptase zinc-binding domain protein [Tanacetum coccineum]